MRTCITNSIHGSAKVNLVTIILWRIVTCSHHDTYIGLQIVDRISKYWCGQRARENVNIHTCASKDLGTFICEIFRSIASIAPNNYFRQPPCFHIGRNSRRCTMYDCAIHA